ncbi:O-antigen ligase family protein [uncultured Devosia sp.]|uniref:O-antigen ligase family protein n=1 Tax=uncultured Devosia sp. TaxID=211434 RepID=UPI0035CC7405
MLKLFGSVLAVSALVFIAVASSIADYVALATALIGLATAIGQRSPIVTARGWWMPALALALLALTLPLVYRGPLDLLPLAALSPLLLVPGVAFLVARNDELLNGLALPLLCLIGVIVAFFVGLSESDGGTVRVGAGNNPIHFGGLSVMVGFMALSGVCVGRSPWRLLFLTGPLFGLAVVMLSGSRGPLLGGVAMAVASLPLLVAWFWRDKWFVAVFGVLAAGATIAGVMLASSMRAISLFGDTLQALSGTAGGVLDPNRTALYTAAREQFMASPIVGQGFGQVMALVRARFPDVEIVQTLEHLHSDIADFGAGGGVLGLAAYGLVIATPLVVTLRRGADRAVIMGGVLLSTGYFGLGLTNAMFGILPQTVLYVVLLGYLAGLARAGRAT